MSDVKVANPNVIEVARECIPAFFLREYDRKWTDEDEKNLINNPTSIGVAFTEEIGDVLAIQVSLDLVNFRVIRDLSLADGRDITLSKTYDSEKEFISNVLKSLDFSDLIYISMEEAETLGFSLD